MRAVPHEHAQEVVTARPGGVSRRLDYIGSPGVIDAEPQAFYVDRLYAGARIDPHFHDIDQFQVVVDGDCAMGKKPAPPISFQYADAYTPYGPIVDRGAGFAFFTLRPIASGGFFAMPGNRQHMPGRAGRNIAGRFDLATPGPGAGAVERTRLMESQPDGAGAIGIRLGQGAEASGPESDAGGQYYLVCAGEAEVAGRRLAGRSLIHIASGEAAPRFTAGPSGADILCLQFARPTERPGSDPAERANRDPNAYMRRPDDPAGR